MLTGKGQAFGANAWNFSTCRRDRESAKLFFYVRDVNCSEEDVVTQTREY